MLTSRVYELNSVSIFAPPIVPASEIWEMLSAPASPVDGMRAIRQPLAVKPFKAIAAMSLNRVIGAGNKIPWHLPEDFKWFKQMTTGHVIVMGRKTFESIGKPLPNRTTIVLTRSSAPITGVQTISELSQLDPGGPALAGREIFICGGAQVYQQ